MRLPPEAGPIKHFSSPLNVSQFFFVKLGHFFIDIFFQYVTNMQAQQQQLFKKKFYRTNFKLFKLGLNYFVFSESASSLVEPDRPPEGEGLRRVDHLEVAAGRIPASHQDFRNWSNETKHNISEQLLN